MVDASASVGELLSGLAPVRVGFVVDDVIGAEFFENSSLGVTAGCGDDTGTGGFGELEGVS